MEATSVFSELSVVRHPHTAATQGKYLPAVGIVLLPLPFLSVVAAVLQAILYVSEVKDSFFVRIALSLLSFQFFAVPQV
jgi:hypothetical protein